jgi:hypothetical protein
LCPENTVLQPFGNDVTEPSLDEVVSSGLYGNWHATHVRTLQGTRPKC